MTAIFGLEKNSQRYAKMTLSLRNPSECSECKIFTCGMKLAHVKKLVVKQADILGCVHINNLFLRACFLHKMRATGEWNTNLPMLCEEGMNG